MTAHKRACLLIFTGVGLLMTQFQNCAPSQPGVLAVSDEVRVVDRWNPQKIQFLATSYLVPDDVDNVNIEGLCESDLVDYIITKVSEDGFTEMIGSGSANCSAGSFSVAMTATSSYLNTCSELVEIEAYLPGSNNAAKTSLKMRCF